MKPTFSIILFLFFARTTAQYRFFYTYTYVPDIEKRDSLAQDLMILDADLINKKSIFFSASVFKRDSLMEIFTKEENPEKMILPKYNPNLMYSVSKNLDKNDIIYHITYSNIKFKITEKERPVWEISNEKKEILNYSCQKATTNYKGRNWTAWFINDIPFQDGPYKFAGLPGLIAEIYDSNEEHKFSLNQIEKNKQIKLPDSYKDEKEITIKQLDNLMDEKYNDINNDIREMRITNNSYNFILNDGNILQVDKSTKNIEKELSKQMLRLKNPLELEK